MCSLAARQRGDVVVWIEGLEGGEPSGGHTGAVSVAGGPRSTEHSPRGGRHCAILSSGERWRSDAPRSSPFSHPFGVIICDGRDETVRTARRRCPPRASSGSLRISSIVLAPDANRFELHVGPSTCYLLEVRHTTRSGFRDDDHNPVFLRRVANDDMRDTLSLEARGPRGKPGPGHRRASFSSADSRVSRKSCCFLGSLSSPPSRSLCAALPPGAQPEGRDDVGRRAAHGLQQGAYLCRRHGRCRSLAETASPPVTPQTAPISPPKLLSHR